MLHVACCVQHAAYVQSSGTAVSTGRIGARKLDDWAITKKAVSDYGSAKLIPALMQIEPASLSDQQLALIRRAMSEDWFQRNMAQVSLVCGVVQQWLAALLEAADLAATNDDCMARLNRLRTLRSAKTEVCHRPGTWFISAHGAP